jgi:hypothetical protein
MLVSATTTASTKSPLDAAQKIVAELHGMTPENQALALKFAMETLALQLPVSHVRPMIAPAHLPHAGQPPLVGTPVQRTDIKSFTTAKGPKSDQQFAAVVAYYYQFEAPADQRKDSIDVETMKEAARLVGRRQAPQWRFTLQNATNAGYLSVGGRGSYKLSPVGENLVAISLPDNATSGKGNSAGFKKKAAKQKSLTGKKTAKKK